MEPLTFELKISETYHQHICFQFVEINRMVHRNRQIFIVENPHLSANDNFILIRIVLDDLIIFNRYAFRIYVWLNKYSNTFILEFHYESKSSSDQAYN